VRNALVAIAGAAGALTRYQVMLRVGVRSFPWATLAINLAGSFLLGLVLKIGLDRGWPETTVLPLGMGFLGAFTTFSTFSAETHVLLRDGRASTAAIYVAASVLGGVLAAAAGYTLARTLS
jgi:CrcB protein